MVKIDFEHLKIYQNLAKSRFSIVDVKEQVADSLYQKGQGIAFHALALKIYNSKGECELTKEEYALLMDFIKQMCTPNVIEAFEAFGNTEEQ